MDYTPVQVCKLHPCTVQETRLCWTPKVKPNQPQPGQVQTYLHMKVCDCLWLVGDIAVFDILVNISFSWHCSVFWRPSSPQHERRWWMCNKQSHPSCFWFDCFPLCCLFLIMYLHLCNWTSTNASSGNFTAPSASPGTELSTCSSKATINPGYKQRTTVLRRSLWRI